MHNHPEYTGREKEMRINEIEVGAILETAQELLNDTKEQLDNERSRLNGIQQQLHDTSLELIRHTHNIGAIIGKIDDAIAKLMKGGGAE